MGRSLFVPVFVLIALVWYIFRSGAPKPNEEVMVPMRDGIRLATDVFLPPGGADKQHPVLLLRTCYGKTDEERDLAPTIRAGLKRGYVMVVQDVRGLFRSEGDLKLYEQEGKDGYDTIEWAARQKWSNGRVGMWGVSYRGATQWLAAGELPPSLRAIVPGQTFSNIDHFLFYGGVFDVGWARWIWEAFAPPARQRLGLAPPKTEPDRERAFAGFVPLAQNPHLKDVAPYYYDWIRRGPYSPEWKWGDLRPKFPAVGRAKIAVLNYSSWYDDSYGPHGAVDAFRGLGEGSPLRNRLLLGPWVHGTYAGMTPRAGERVFPPQARVDYTSVALDFLDMAMRGKKSPVAGAALVYVMGLDRWVETDHWPISGRGEETFFLGPKRLSWRPQKTGETVFVSDPANPVRDRWNTAHGAFDLRELSLRDDVLTFETDPMTEDLVVIGAPRVRLFVSSDAPDFDLYARVLDVDPEGRAFNLTSPGNEVIRASYREGKPARKLLKSGEIVELKFDRAITGNAFLKGHRVRLLVHASWFPTFPLNPQNGETELQSANRRPARIHVHFGKDHPSRLELPAVTVPKG